MVLKCSWMTRRLKRFQRDARGTVIILFAMTAPVLVAAMSAGLNFAQYTNAQLSLQAALDAATLAAADQLSEGERDNTNVQKIGRDTFESGIEDFVSYFQEPPQVNFDIDREKNIVQGDATGNIKYVMQVFKDTLSSDVKANSEATFGKISVELAMTLDVTGSMSGSRIRDLKNAATEVIEILVDENYTGPTEEGVRVGLVPYSAAVNTGDFTSTVTGTPSPSSNCVVERAGVEEYNDTSPVDAPIPQHPWAYCPTSEIVPLTRDRAKLIQEIQNLRTGGCTAGHIGIAWTYYMLSPNWNSIWPGDTPIKPYNFPETMKVAIIMTDGAFNTYYNGLSNPVCTSSARTRSERTSRELCDEMRQDGILVYSVAFRAPRSAERLLRDCAGTAGRYFETDSGAELTSAFTAIASEVSNLRLSR